MLKNVVVEISEDETLDFTDKIQSEMNHLSQTTSPEVDSERVVILQNVADSLSANLGIQTQIIIMNRGEEPNAFVFPDGSIYISQSLINRLDSLDEIAAVIAHEINHLRFNTFEKKVKSKSSLDSLGVPWTHELASDIATPELLADAGYNSSAFASAIFKISDDNSRGSAHQSRIARSTAVRVVHRAEDFVTSAKEHTPMPDILKGEFQPTISEIVHKVLWTGLEFQNTKSLVQKMTTEGLFLEFKSFRKCDFGREMQMGTDFADVIIERLTAQGYKQDEIAYFTTMIQFYGQVNFKHTPSFQSCEEIFRAIDDLYSPDTPLFTQMHEKVFGRAHVFDIPDLISQLIQRVVDSDSNSTSVPSNIMLTNKEFDGLVHKIASLDFRNTGDKNRTLTYLLPELIYKYAQSKFAKSVSLTGRFDENEVRAFFQKYASLGFDLTYFGKYVERDIQEFHWQYEDRLLRRTRRMSQFDNIFIDIFKANEVETDLTVDVEKLINSIDSFEERNNPQSLVAYLVQYLRNQNLPEGITREDIAERVSNKIASLDLKCTYNFIRESDGQADDLSPEEEQRMSRLYNLHMQMTALLAIYADQRDDQFYSKLGQLFEDNSDDIHSMDLSELVFFFHGIFAKEVSTFSNMPPHPKSFKHLSPKIVIYRNVVEPESNLLNLLPARLIHERMEEQQFASIADMISFVSGFREYNPYIHLGFFSKPYSSEQHLYSDDVLTVLLGDKIKRRFNEILSEGLGDDQLSDLRSFIADYFPPGVRKDYYLSKIDSKALYSEQLTLHEKTVFLQEHFDSCGLEGLSILASQIETIDDFRIFKEAMQPQMEAYLEANRKMTQMALADQATSFLVGRSNILFESASSNPMQVKESSTRAAAHWLETMLGDRRIFEYSQESNTIKPQLGNLISTSSFKDLVTKVKSFSLNERLGIALKALTDSDGALSSDKTRATLAEMVVKMLEIPNGFTRASVEAAIQHVKADSISLPIAQLTAPLLFRAFDEQAVDFGRLMNTVVGSTGSVWTHHKPSAMGRNIRKLPQVITGGFLPIVGDTFGSEDNLRQILTSETHEILDYRIVSSAGLGAVFNSARNQYVESLDSLQSILGDNDPESFSTERTSSIDPGTEAVIRGLEASGPIGVRALQLASQLQDFSPELRDRLAQTLDSNEGLNKLHFWNNLNKLSENDEEIGRFVQERLIRVGKYLGGGSLNTAFEAYVRTNDGGEHRVVLKMLNPNSKSIIEETYIAASTSLHAVEKDSPQYRTQVRNAMLLVDLANQWCLADINDPSFLADDEQYRKNVTSHMATEEVRYVIPEVILQTFKLKSEDALSGQTANKVLSDPNIDEVTKQRVARALGELFVHELVHPTTTESGDSIYLVRSDPHPGNQIVEIDEDGRLSIGIIDRHMFLKFSQTEVDIAKQLILKDTQVGISMLLDRIIELNKVKGKHVKLGIMTQLVKRRLSQKARGSEDDLEMIQVLSSECAQRGLDIPIQLRLLIKNIESIRKLTSEQDIDLAQVYDDYLSRTGI